MVRISFLQREEDSPILSLGTNVYRTGNYLTLDGPRGRLQNVLKSVRFWNYPLDRLCLYDIIGVLPLQVVK